MPTKARDKVQFASLMDLCQLKNSEVEPKGRVVLRGDIVKDASGSYAVLTEQGSSASQMTAAKVLDVKSRLQGFSGQAADAVSAKTLIWENQHHFLTMLIWVAPNESVKLVMILWQTAEVCSNQGFLPGLQKNGKKQSHGET